MRIGVTSVMIGTAFWMAGFAYAKTDPQLYVATTTSNPSFEQTLTLYASIQGAAITGTVTFLENGFPIAGCAGIPSLTPGDSALYFCSPPPFPFGTHVITAQFSGDANNAAASAAVTQFVVPSTPGVAIIERNPYGSATISGATVVGNVLTNLGSDVVVQLGATPGIQGTPLVMRVYGLQLKATTMTFRPGAPGQEIEIIDDGPYPTVIAAPFTVESTSYPAPKVKLTNPHGIAVQSDLSAPSGLKLYALGANAKEGGPITSDSGGVDGGSDLDLRGSSISGRGAFYARRITLSTFGNIRKDTGSVLTNGVFLGPSLSVSDALDVLLNAYGDEPQFINVAFLGGGPTTVSMPSAWAPGVDLPTNNAVNPPNGRRPSSVPPPSYGGGSLLINGFLLALGDSGSADFVFPGAIVFIANQFDFNGVAVDQGWTVDGRPFQGMFFDAPTITDSKGQIRLYGNALNWANFLVMPSAPVRSFSLATASDGSASFVSSDATAPHLNDYFNISVVAASGGCWICLINPSPVWMYGP